jgi:DNA-binding response OmpR family regulator
MLEPISSRRHISRDPVRIAVADDEADTRQLLAAALRQDGHTVTLCENGRELFAQIDAAATVGGVALPDLIISDVRMPEMTGLEMLEAMRAARIDVPVILITAFGDDGVHAEAFDLGAVVMDKPVRVEALRAAVRCLARRRPEPRAREQVRAAQGSR